MARDESSWELLRLPPGYSFGMEQPGLLTLRRADGSVVAVFAFSAFGPSPESVRLAAEDDHRTFFFSGDEQADEPGAR